jgi:hypothetical protein
LNSKSEYVLILFLLVDGVLIFGTIILLQLDWIVNHTLYSYNLTFSVDWAVPYWTFLRLIFGAFFSAIIGITFLGVGVYRQVRERNRMPVYICETCGSAWTSTSIRTEVEKEKNASKFRFIKNCPRCNKNLLTE